jgi:hypothetical protein
VSCTLTSFITKLEAMPHHHLLGIGPRDPPCTVFLRSYIITRILGSLAPTLVCSSLRLVVQPTRIRPHLAPSPLCRISNFPSTPPRLWLRRCPAVSCVK